MKKLLLISLLFISVISFGQVPNYVPTDSLVGWWPFNGNANDQSSNGYNGIVNGAILTNDRFGNPNNAYLFNGINDFIETSDLNELDSTEKLTLSVWVKVTSASNSRIIGKSNGPGINRQGLMVDNYQMTSKAFRYNCITETPKQTMATENNTILIDSIMHIVVVFDGTQQTNESKGKFYINGSILDSLIYEDPDSGNPINLPEYTPANSHAVCFGSSAGNGAFFNGILDDIGIWNRALDSCEILDLYNASINSCTNSINELDNKLIKLFPNPSNGFVNLEISHHTNCQIILTNILGEEVLSKSFNSNKLQLNLNKLDSKGTYFIKVLNSTGNVIAIKKLIYQ